MNLLFLTLSHITDVNCRGIYTDLMRKFRDEGHQVYIVTPCERRLKRVTSLTIQERMHVLSVKTLNIQSTNVVEKGVGTLLIEYQFKKAILHFFKDIQFDLILYSTPPITFTGVIKWLKKEHNAMSYLLLKDIFPQNAVDLGFFSKRSIFYYYFRNREKQLYRVSDHIGCMSPANVDFVLRHNSFLQGKSIEVNPNSIALSEREENTDRITIREKYDLPLDKIIFIYGGNLGKPQGLDFLLKILETNKNKSECYFLIVGSGTEYLKIKNWFDKNDISNASLLNGLSRQEYDRLIKGGDVGLIFLDARFTIPNYPSRLLTYMENKMPVLAATDECTDVGKIAGVNNYGFWCKNGDINTFNEKIDLLLDEKLRMNMGKNGYDYLIKNYLVDSSYQIIMKHFSKS